MKNKTRLSEDNGIVLKIIQGNGLLFDYEDYILSVIEATSTTTGSMTSYEKTKLRDIEDGAQKSVVFNVAGRTGDVILEKTDVGLDQVNNTSDLTKPLSNASTTAIGNKVIKVDNKVLSANDYTTTEKNKLRDIETGAQKNVVDSVAGRTGAVTLSKTDVGLGNVNNTPDAQKSVLKSGEATTATKTKEKLIFTGDSTAVFDGSTVVPQIIVPTPYVLPIASSTVLGGIKPDGTSILVSPEGVLTAPSGGGSAPSDEIALNYIEILTGKGIKYTFNAAYVGSGSKTFGTQTQPLSYFNTEKIISLNSAQICITSYMYYQSGGHHFMFTLYSSYSGSFYAGSTMISDNADSPHISGVSANNYAIFSIYYYPIPISLTNVTRLAYSSNNSSSVSSFTYPTLISNQYYFDYVSASYSSYLNKYFFIISVEYKESDTTKYNTSLWTSSSPTSSYTKVIDNYSGDFVHGKNFSISYGTGKSHTKTTNGTTFTTVTTTLSIGVVIWVKYLEVFYVNSSSNIYVTTDYVNFNIVLEKASIQKGFEDSNSYIYYKNSKYYWNYLDKGKNFLIINNKLISNISKLKYIKSKDFYILNDIAASESVNITIN
jgi:hypothetical protein